MKHAAVLGKPIAHSRSPLLHRTAYRLLGVDIEYGRLELDPAQATDFIARLRTENWAGCSVTMPLKDVFVPLVDSRSATVERMGALNTIVRRPDGTLHAENTDVAGIVLALADAGVRHSTRASILGAGNTALAAIEALALIGVQELDFVVRDTSRAAATVAFAQKLGMNATAHTVGSHRLTGCPVVISTLPPTAADSWVPRLGTGDGVLLDVAYDPWPSQLAAAWTGPVINGLAMLVHQAVEQVRLFSGIELDTATRQNVTNAMFNAVGLHRGQ